jgi:hypothetical protein
MLEFHWQPAMSSSIRHELLNPNRLQNYEQRRWFGELFEAHTNMLDGTLLQFTNSCTNPELTVGFSGIKIGYRFRGAFTHLLNWY